MSSPSRSSPGLLVVCEEVFDETSHPSEEEVREYAVKLGIDPDTEPQLLPLAADGLMQALPPGWKPLYDDQTKSYYYYNNTTGKTQWEHPLDDVYRGLVQKARSESQSFSLGEQLEDATYNRDDIPSIEEVPTSSNVLKPIDAKLSPLKHKPKSAKIKLGKQKSAEERPASSYHNRIGLSMFNSFDDIIGASGSKKDSRPVLDKHPKGLEKSTEFTLSGGGSMFLKSNTKKIESPTSSSLQKKPIAIATPPKGILREKSFTFGTDSEREFSSTTAPEDKMHVRFNLDKKAEIKFSYSDKSSEDEDDDMIESNLTPQTESNLKGVLKISPPKNRFTVSPVLIDPLFLSESQDELNNCKIIGKDGATENLKPTKPNPIDSKQYKFNKKISETGEEKAEVTVAAKLLDEKFDINTSRSNNKLGESDASIDYLPEDGMANKEQASTKSSKDIFVKTHNTEMPSKFKKTEPLVVGEENERQSLILSKQQEIEIFKQELSKEKMKELEQLKIEFIEAKNKDMTNLLAIEKNKYEEKIKEALETLRAEMEQREKSVLDSLCSEFDNKLDKRKKEIEKTYTIAIEQIETELQQKLENQKKELNAKFQDQVREIEKEIELTLDERKKDVSHKHNTVLDVLKKEHASYIEELKRNFRSEEQILKKEHQTHLSNLKEKFANEIESERNRSIDDRTYEKMRCEKRLLEDKYKCLKEKYLRLKSDVKLTIEKRSKKREQSLTTTGSETERTHSVNNKKEKNPANSPAHKQTKSISTNRLNGNVKSSRPIVINLDASLSDRNNSSNNNMDPSATSDNAESGNPQASSRTKRKFFSRLKSSSTSRINDKAAKSSSRTCSPVENLRRQLQKLEDLEDQFPENPHQPDQTCHIRYPFSDADAQYGGELEFFRHRIHLERDSVKRAKETLRTQRTNFQKRQRELNLKYGNAARGTLQQLLQEEKDLSDMEVSLHRTRGLLGEKVIRLRHLEQSLQRATVSNDYLNQRQEDVTLSDLSSHSASSGISSSDFATGPSKHLHVNLQESSEIMQSLENLNSEIREIWEVLNKQQQGNITAVIPPISLMYPDLGWAVGVAPPSIPTLADRLNNYRQQAALANAQSTMVTHATQGATTTLVERTRNLKHWLRQVAVDPQEGTALGQATL